VKLAIMASFIALLIVWVANKVANQDRCERNFRQPLIRESPGLNAQNKIG